MKIKVLSDIHLEFGGFDAGKGDVLILAGDIVNVSEINKIEKFGKDSYQVVLKGGATLKVSRSRYQELKLKLGI